MSFTAPTQAISTLPAAPSRALEEAAFESAVDEMLAADAALVTEINALRSQIATLVGELNAAGGEDLIASLETTFSMSATSITTLSVAVFDVTLTGVLDTDTLVVTPVEWSATASDRAKINIKCYYISANTVRVIVGNPSAATATLTAGTWRLAAYR